MLNNASACGHSKYSYVYQAFHIMFKWVLVNQGLLKFILLNMPLVNELLPRILTIAVSLNC